MTEHLDPNTRRNPFLLFAKTFVVVVVVVVYLIFFFFV